MRITIHCLLAAYISLLNNHFPIHPSPFHKLLP